MGLDGSYILLVEDEEGDEALMLHALKKAKLLYDVEVVHDGEEALDFLFCRGGYRGRDFCRLPTLVILDLNLPKVSGLEVLKSIRTDERTRHLLVVILTSSTADQDVIRGYGLGTNGYVRKSMDRNEFEEGIKQLLLYWTVINEPPRNRAGMQPANADYDSEEGWKR